MKLLSGAKTDFFFRTSLRIFLIRFFPTLATLWVMVLFSRKLDTSEYGTYQLFITQSLLLRALGCAGLQAVLITFSPAVVNQLISRTKRRTFLLLGVWIFLWSALFSFLQPVPQLPSATAFAFLLFYILQTLAEVYLTATHRFKPLIFLNAAYTFFFILLHMLLLKGTLSFTGLFTALAVMHFLKTAVSIQFIRRYRNAASESQAGLPSPHALRSLWTYLGLYDVIQLAYIWIDKFLLGFFLTAEMFAVYYNGSVSIPFLPLILGAAANTVLIQLSTHPEADFQKQAVRLMQHAARILSALVYPLFFFLVFYRQELFTVVFTSKYQDAVPIFLATLWVLPLRAYSFTAILQNRYKGKIILAGAIGDLLLASVLMYPLYCLWGLPGVALSFVLSTYVQSGYYLLATSRVLRVNIRTLMPWANWLGKAVVCGICFGVISAWKAVEDLPPAGRLAGGACLAALLAFFFLRKELRSKNAERQE